MQWLPGMKGKKDDLDRQFEAQQEQQNMDIASSTLPEEQMALHGRELNHDLTRWQQDLDPIIDSMIHRLKCEVMTEEGNFVPLLDHNKKPIPPLCSDECIYKLIAVLEPNASRNVMMSKFDSEHIGNIMYALESDIIIDILVDERKKYRTPLSHLSEVKIIFRSFALPTFYRALGGGERRYLGTIRTVKELHNASNMDEGKKKGLFAL